MSGHLNRRRRLLLRHPAYARAGEVSLGPTSADEGWAGGHERPAGTAPSDLIRLQQQFRKAAEVPAGVVLSITSNSGEVVNQHPFEQATLLIGRDPALDLRLDDRQIARAQVALQWCAGRLLVINLNGAPVVRLGGQPVQCAWWRPSTELQVGPYNLCLVGWTAPSPLPAEPQARCVELQQELQPLALRMRDRAGTTRDWPVNRRVALVGRASWCRMSIQDPAFAKVQSVLVRTRGGLWLVGLDAEDWPIVNQRRTPLAQFDPGDRWSLGEYELELTTTASSTKPEVEPSNTAVAGEQTAFTPADDSREGLRSWLVAARLRCQELQLSCAELDLRRDELQLRRAELQTQLKLLEQLTDLTRAGKLQTEELRREQVRLVQQWLQREPRNLFLKQFLRDLQLELSGSTN